MNLQNTARPRGFLLIMSILALLLSTSCGKDSSDISIPGVDGPHVDLDPDTGRLMVSMTFTKFDLPIGGRFEVPKYPGSYIELGPGVNPVGTFLALNFDLADILNDDLQNEDPKSLPGGRPLPGLRSGKLPGVAFSIEKWRNVTLYVGQKVFGIFIPHDMGFRGNAALTVPFKKGGNQIGLISAIGQDEDGENSGFLLLLDMNESVKYQLESLLEESEEEEDDFFDF